MFLDHSVLSCLDFSSGRPIERLLVGGVLQAVRKGGSCIQPSQELVALSLG
jgi:hypothetical protein